MADAARQPGALLRDAALAYGAVALLVAPWLPTLLSQAQHTGAPWALHPRLASLEQAVYRTLGDGKSAMVLLLAGGAGLAAIRLPRDRALVTSLVVLAAGTAAVAFVYSQFSLAWATRYLSVLVGPLLLLAAAGLARSGRLGLVGLALVAFFWWGMPSVASLHDKSNVETLTSRFAERLRPGDLVISTQPEQVPNLKYYLPAGLRYASTLGPVGDPRLMDWRDARERLQAADAARIQRGVIASVQPGRRILVVAPLTRAGGWRALWTKLVRRRSQQWLQRLAADPSLQPVARWKPTARSKKSTVHAVLYFKRSR